MLNQNVINSTGITTKVEFIHWKIIPIIEYVFCNHRDRERITALYKVLAPIKARILIRPLAYIIAKRTVIYRKNYRHSYLIFRNSYCYYYDTFIIVIYIFAFTVFNLI